ncbi:MAG: homoserine kinase [Nitrospira sp.]|nr:homoserine kinase [Candidatus Manganitrophaceae bacterium]HIL34890.1 homoserine kinase [Candidatus Manganitrophaceae bacterium]
MKNIRIFAPGSVGNIGPGFDVLGMAVSGIGDTVSMTKRSEGGVSILGITGDQGRLSHKADENTAGIAAQVVLDHLGVSEGVDLKLHKDIPGTGLGSSAASAVAASLAVNSLFGNPLTKDALIPLAAVAETKVSGGLFLDNVGPSMMGGVTWNNPFTQEVVSLGCIDQAVLVIITPDFALLTKDARRVLPSSIEMKQFVHNMAYAAMISWAVAKNDLDRFGQSIEDHVAEPSRGPLIKGFADVKKAALSAGALGCSISGAGATIFAVCGTKEKGEKIGRAMADAFERNHVVAKFRVTKMDQQGARIAGN